MSHENLEIVRRGYERFAATGQFAADLSTPDFVWDMSKFHGWPERQIYEGVEEAQAFLSEWGDSWDDWDVEAEAFLDVGEKVAVLVRQRGRSKATGLPVEMYFAQVFTVRAGKQTRMDMYSDPDEALKAVGLAE